jgi:hypothetical protein
MADQKWLDGWSGQSVDELISLVGEYRTDSIVLAFEQAIQSKAGELSEVEQIVLAVEALERVVNNGGYGQFFANCSEFAPMAVAALKAIGSTSVAMLTEKATQVLSPESPITEASVRQAIDKADDQRDEKLSACDSEYFQVAGDLAGPLLEYIKNHKDQITFS